MMNADAVQSSAVAGVAALVPALPNLDAPPQDAAGKLRFRRLLRLAWARSLAQAPDWLD